jgi:SAM-dependent methyltransferase
VSESPTASPQDLDVLAAVRARYARGAQTQVRELRTPVEYEARLLDVLPPEILERDYGCGDPSRFARPGDVVLDLGSGAGKICYLASQLVGREGRVIGVDATPEMLALAREHRHAVGERIGWHNVRFHRGHIQDLALDLERLEAWMAAHPVRDAEGLERLRAEEARLRREQPMVPDASVDLVLSNCVLNLVAHEDKQRLFAEIARVLRPGGRCAISDITSDEDVPAELMRDPELWSGCIAGAMREDRFLQAFVDAGLRGVELVKRQADPWAVVKGLEFRSVTVVAWKAAHGPDLDHHEAVIYKGPWSEVADDEGHVLRRGERTAVSRRTFGILTRDPYAAHVTPVPPLVPVPESQARPFACCGPAVRDPRVTKAGVTRPDSTPSATTSCCDTGSAPPASASSESSCCGGGSRS